MALYQLSYIDIYTPTYDLAVFDDASHTARLQDIDAGVGAAMTIGATNATAIDISKTGILTTIKGGCTIEEGLTVNGTTTLINTSVLNVTDPIVRIQQAMTNPPTVNSAAGLSVYRGGTVDNALSCWRESPDEWVFFFTADDTVVDPTISTSGYITTRMENAHIGGGTAEDRARNGTVNFHSGDGATNTTDGTIALTHAATPLYDMSHGVRLPDDTILALGAASDATLQWVNASSKALFNAIQWEFAGNLDCILGLDVSGADMTFTGTAGSWTFVLADSALTQTGTGQVTITGNVDATLGLDVTGGALTVDNQAITQTTGGQVTFAGNVDANDGVNITQAIVAGGSPDNLISATGAAHTAITASTEASNGLLDFSATKQWATGALATQREFRLLAPTYAFVGASVITDAATVYIDNAPQAGANCTITNPYALWVDNGVVRFDGGITTSGGLTITGGDITTTAAALNWDLVDDNASALSFDAAGKAGIIEIVTSNGFEGVNMSGFCNVTGIVTGGTVTDGTASITGGAISGVTTIGMAGDLTNYEAVNDANPEIRLGASDAEEAHVQAVYDAGAQTLDYVLFQTDVAGAGADKGQFKFNVDGTETLRVDDDGIEVVGEVRQSRTEFMDEMWNGIRSEWATRTTSGSTSIQSRSNGWYRFTTSAVDDSVESIDWNDICPFVNTLRPTFEIQLDLEQTTVIHVEAGLIEAVAGGVNDYIVMRLDTDDDANWHLAANDSTGEATDAGAAATTNETGLRFWFTSDTELEWAISTDGGVTWTSQGTVTTKVPTVALQPFVYIQTRSAAARYVDVDYVYVSQDRV